MATAELVVAFSAKIDALEGSLKRVENALGSLERSASKANREIADNTERMAASFSGAATSVKAFVLAFAGMQVAQIIRNIVLAVDEMNASFTRLQALTGLTRSSVQGVFSDLQRVAAATGQPLTEMVNQFQRFYTATASIGASAQQVQQLVQTLAQFAQLSGQGPQEAAAAITQLAQGLASGRLQGDELKSILENMPQLAVALARELGVTVGELRKLGEEGKLTAENVFPAILRAGQQMSETLRGLPLTLSQAWQAFKDSAVAAISSVDRAIGASEFLSQLLSTTGAAVRNVTQRAAGTDYIAAGGNIADTLQNTRREIVSTQRLIADLERQLAAVRRGESTGNTDRFGRLQAGLTEPELQASLRVARQRFDALEANRADLAERERQQQANAAAEREREGIRQRVQQGQAEARALREQADPLVKAQRERDEAIAAANRRNTDRLALAGTDPAARANAERLAREEAQAIQRIYAREVQQAGAEGRAAAERARAEAERQRRAAERLSREQQQQVEEIARAGGTGIEAMTRRFREWDTVVQGIGSNYELFIQRVVGGQENVTTLFTAVRREAEATMQALVRNGEDPAQAIRLLNEELEKLRDRLIAAGAPAEQVGEAMARQLNIAGRSLDNLKNKTTKTFQDIVKTGVDSFSTQLADSIVDFAATGEGKFDEMAANFTKMIAKMIVQLLIFRAIVSTMGWMGINIPGLTTGGAMAVGDTYDGDLSAASAASASTPSYLMGSSMPAIPTLPSGSGGDVTVNVYNNSNSKVRTEEKTDSMGNKMIEVFIEQVVKNGMASGRFDGVMQTSFGASRVGRV